MPYPNKLCISRDMVSLRVGQPRDALLFGLGHGGIEDAELHGGNIGSVLWSWTGSIEVCNWNLHVHCPDLVWSRVLREGRDGAEPRQVAGHLGRRCGSRHRVD